MVSAEDCELTTDIIKPVSSTESAPAKPGASVSTAPVMDAKAPFISTGYSLYVLAVLFLVNVFAIIDRQILTVLAEDIKADLMLSDAEIGFVYGTAISVFYAVFSIPLGRFADVGVRKNLLAFCVAAWSLMIFLTGTARNLVSFAVFRAGVGIGEAGVGPTALSMLADYFSPRWRSSAMSVFAAGVPIGAGLGMFLGGFILDWWNITFPDPDLAPFSLRGWQAAFIAIAIPGPLLALWLWTLKEPTRGQSEGITVTSPGEPFQEVGRELIAILPIVNLVAMLHRPDAARLIGLNVCMGLGIAISAVLLTVVTGSAAQWIALGIGFYCIASWAQSYSSRDPAAFAMVLKCRSLVFTYLGIAFYVFVLVGVSAWIVPLMMRMYSVNATEVGAVIGTIIALGGFFGNIAGGLIADNLERYTKRARFYVLLGSVFLTLPSILLFLHAESKASAYIFIAFFYFTSAIWYGIGPSIVTSLVMPRMRGISSAFYLIVTTLLGTSLGPYVMGFMSDLFFASGEEPGSALRLGILWGLLLLAPSAILLILAARWFPDDLKSRNERAVALGEKI